MATLAEAAAALAGGDGPALDRAVAAFAEHGHLLLAAEAAAAARRYQRADLNGRTRVALECATVLASRCQGARNPLLDHHGASAALTRREREIALLAITMPSRQVAERLHLSVNTVNNTIARVFTKLGVSSRGDLATLLSPGRQPGTG